MNRIDDMIRTHPDLREGAMAELGKIMALLSECEAVCRICADACLHEEDVADLRSCIERNNACAQACDTALAALAAGAAHPDESLLAVLDACALACGACARECEMHAEHHEHCRICAEVCPQCEQECAAAISRLAGSLSVDMRGERTAAH
jgi:pyruvate/oxaloacetate carboxyltransferase